jgi:hypothetical protein
MADRSWTMFKSVGALWNLELGPMQPRWVPSIARATVRLFVALAFLNIALGTAILVLILARH